jgi:hypothetical protein
MNFLRRELLDIEGDTFSLGLIRVLLALVLWSRFAMEVSPYYVADPERWALSVVFFASTTAMFVGYYGQAATVVTAMTLWVMKLYFGHHKGFDDWTHHHTNLLVIATTILSLGPCSRSLSLDRWLHPERREVGFLWTQRMLAVQVSTLYLWSAWDKTQWGFLTGERLQMMAMKWYFLEHPHALWFEAGCAIAAWMVVVLEYLLPFALFVPRWQRVLIPVGLVLHGLFYILLPVGTFSVTMATLYVAFVSGETLRRATTSLVARHEAQ